MYQWVRPQLAVPIHGEIRHQTEHARIARSWSGRRHHHSGKRFDHQAGLGPAEVAVQHGRLALDGKRIVPLDAGVMRPSPNDV